MSSSHLLPEFAVRADWSKNAFDRIMEPRRVHHASMLGAIMGSLPEVAVRADSPAPHPQTDSDFQRTIFHASARGEILQVLECLNQGVSVDYQWSSHETALFNAAKFGHLNLAEILIMRGDAIPSPCSRLIICNQAQTSITATNSAQPRSSGPATPVTHLSPICCCSTRRTRTLFYTTDRARCRWR